MDVTEPSRLPGCVLIYAHELLDLMLVDQSSVRLVPDNGQGCRESRQVLVNTFRALEPERSDDMDGVKLRCTRSGLARKKI